MWSQIAEMGHFLEITIVRKTLPFLKKNYIISCDHKMRKWATFCKLRSEEKLYHFSTKNYTISRDREMKKWATVSKLRSQEKLGHFSRKTIQFLLIANCRIGPLSANYHRKRNYTISVDPEMQKWATFCKL